MRIAVAVSLCCAMLAGHGAASAGAAQRIDLEVLLLAANGWAPSFQAWQAQLRREGVPFDQLIAGPGHPPITPATLSRTLTDGTQEARYQAVIVAVGGLPRCDASGCVSALAAEEWAALSAFEQAFHVRRLTAYAFPGPELGLTPPFAWGPLDGTLTTLKVAGAEVFPYLDGVVPIHAGTWGYEATPIDPSAFTTLLASPSGAALVGVFRHADGREEMVQTFDGNPFQLHSQLLRHGQLAWVTRGTYLGDQRNYLELHVDDVFLPDDIWDPVNDVTDYDPEHGVRMTPADVGRAVTWSQASGLRLDAVFNGDGSVAHVAEHGSDPLLDAFLANRAAFGWINHTFTHSNLDCSTRGFIVEEIERNLRWARTRGFPVARAELVTGEHSGLANLIPGNPGMIDAPGIEQATAVGRGGTLAPGTYDYAVTATSVHGETVAATATAIVPARSAATGAVNVGWEAICHATAYKVYRRGAAGTWALIATVPQPSNAFRLSGPATIRYRDTGGAGTAGEPPSVSTAAIDPYGQNPGFIGALRETGVRYVGGDASKPYPQNPLDPTGSVWPAGTSFVDGPARVIPRYPTNIFYNTATREQQLDEYNYIYLPPWLGGACASGCRDAPATWEDYVAAESQTIFAHMMGNDPRPHYVHQSNLALSDRPDGAILYPVLDATLERYRRYFNETAPIVQLTHTQIGDLLARQDAWATASAGSVTGYVEGASVTIVNANAATRIPLTGTEVGGHYAGLRSGWVGAPGGSSTHTAATAWPAEEVALPQPVGSGPIG